MSAFRRTANVRPSTCFICFRNGHCRARPDSSPNPRTLKPRRTQAQLVRGPDSLERTDGLLLCDLRVLDNRVRLCMISISEVVVRRHRKDGALRWDDDWGVCNVGLHASIVLTPRHLRLCSVSPVFITVMDSLSHRSPGPVSSGSNAAESLSCFDLCASRCSRWG